MNYQYVKTEKKLLGAPEKQTKIKKTNSELT